jgi:hypothetical protein
MCSSPRTCTPSADPNVAIGRIRSAGRGAAAEYGLRWVTVARVGGQSTGSLVGHPVGPDRYVAGMSWM